MSEVWKDIPGFEGRYQASSLGNIRSLDREQIIANRWGTQTTRKLLSKVLVPVISKSGYSYHQLGHGSKKETHYWIATTFLGPRVDNKEVNHINFNRADNRVENLEWTTRSENRRHSLSEKRGNTVKLSTEDVLEIRKLKKAGVATKSLCNKYNIDKHTVSNIMSGKTWSWL